MWEDNRDGLFHWRKSYNGLWTEAKVYSENGFVSYKLYKTLIDGLYYYLILLLVCFYQLLGLSFWRHPFTAEDLVIGEQTMQY